ncbi:MAG: response regulator [Deltaproteobacteria bacterium]|nr:response regulator [Deltaproteobacteria bacterium]
MKILVVDDELPVCDFLEEFLSLHGHEVSTAMSGEEAVSSFRKNRAHVVLMDIKMPGISGIDALRMIKDIESNTGVFILSAFGDPYTKQKAFQSGADFFMEKPIEIDILLQELDKWQESHKLRGIDEST